MMDRIALKEYAKSRISGRRVEIWKALIFLFLGNFVVNMIIPVADVESLTNTYLSQSDVIQFARTTIISSLITTLLLQPLTYGVNQSLMDFDKEDFIENNTVFAAYKKIIKIFVLTVFISIICAAPMIILMVICIFVNTSYASFLLAISLGGLANMIISYFYVAVPYIFNDMQEASIIEIMHTSRKMMKGHKLEFFILCISFTGWYILVILTCGLFMIWLLPYISFTNAKYFLDLKNDYFGVEVEVSEEEGKENPFTIG